MNPGAVWSWTNDPVASSGVSFELSGGYNFQFVDEWYSPHLGALLRYGSVDDGVNDGAQRGAVSAQGGVGPLGLELGFGWRGAMGDEAPQRNGVIVAPFASAGFLYIGPEWFFPVGSPLTTPELSLNFGLKIPIVQIVWGIQALGSMWSRVPSGRPLRVDGQARVARVVGRASAWSGPHSPDVRGLSARERARLARHWLSEARAEHASVPAFALLALSLARFAAPPALVAACHRAALDEIEHTKACFGLATAYGGSPSAPLALDTEGVEVAPTLLALARESLADGWFAEGTAAALARAALRKSGDPSVRRALSRIARQEQRHAQLGISIALFALEREPKLAADLARAVSAVLDEPTPCDHECVSPAERWHGLLSDRERAAVIRRARRRAARAWLSRARSLSLPPSDEAALPVAHAAASELLRERA